jgi:hypothetical protein
VVFPGNQKSWTCKSNDSSSDMIARQTLYLTLNLPASAKGEAYNVADERPFRDWSTKWPALASYFGLKGVGPEKAKPEHEIRRYIKDHLDTWKQLEQKHSLQSGFADSDRVFPGFEYFLLTQFDFDRQYDMTKTYSTGFTEERDTLQAWGPVFDRMRAAKIIP